MDVIERVGPYGIRKISFHTYLSPFEPFDYLKEPTVLWRYRTDGPGYTFVVTQSSGNTEVGPYR